MNLGFRMLALQSVNVLNIQQFNKIEDVSLLIVILIAHVIGKELKKRKQQKRKHRENQEPCVMRGVYFKNMKWQAAIKVEKKQVHLGTVDSQEEAARLYDRFVTN